MNYYDDFSTSYTFIQKKFNRAAKFYKAYDLIIKRLRITAFKVILIR